MKTMLITSGPDKGKRIMDHVVQCLICNYTTNIAGDLPKHKKEKHPKHFGNMFGAEGLTGGFNDYDTFYK